MRIHQHLISVLVLGLPLSAQSWTVSASSLPSSHSAAAYDAARNQIVVFGGGNAETWVWDENGWTQMAPSTTPPPRYNSAMAYDETRQYVVMFGGQDSSGPSQLSDTWVWDGSNWTQKFPFSAPRERTTHTMAYVTSTQRVTLVGGNGTRAQEMWEWDGINWVQRFPSPTVAFYRHAMAYDDARDRIVVFSQDGETWEWDNLTWTKRTPAPQPNTRENSAMAYDRTRGRVVLYGGHSPGFLGTLQDQWEWDGANWTQAAPAVSPGKVRDHRMGYHAARQSVFLVGSTGNWEYGSTPAASFVSFGQGCQGTHGGTPQITAQNPIIGQNLAVGLTNGPPTAVAVLMFGTSPISIALDPFGAPGCVLLTSPAATMTLFTDPNGNLANPLAFIIPSLSELKGALLYNQWAVFDPGANNLNLIFSDGGIGTLGF